MESLADKKRIITRELKVAIVPALKARGYTGSFPHFRKMNGDQFDFLSFQFHKFGGSFVVEIGSASREDLPGFVRSRPFEKLNYSYTPDNKRKRITPESSQKDYWYGYSDFNHQNQYTELANFVKVLLIRQKLL